MSDSLTFGTRFPEGLRALPGIREGDGDGIPTASDRCRMKSFTKGMTGRGLPTAVSPEARRMLVWIGASAGRHIGMREGVGTKGIFTVV